MKIKNKDLKRVNSALFSLGNHQGSINDRWQISKMAKPFKECVELLDTEVQNLIQRKGISKDGQITLSKSDKEYQELMVLGIDVNFEKLPLSELERYMPTVQELIDLESIIKEGE